VCTARGTTYIYKYNTINSLDSSSHTVIQTLCVILRIGPCFSNTVPQKSRRL